ncbi:MAG: dimethyl sulfoxide reductase anchor subunit [Coriobacteriaceae bacterium]|jgi:anaerobic dimethyl sulfoxide reductase subunit C (anchor subunit)|nr:dimethyl sulfoxide reductase anchor subunit [Coriobacteriaceae bacterium]
MEIQWALIIFTLFTAFGSGLFAIQGLLALLGKGEKIQLPALVTAFAAIVVGGLASFTHLQHWDRAFNGFGRLTSGITQELIGIVVVVLCMVVYFVFLRRGSIPKGIGAVALVLGVALIVVMTTSYMMPARPVWTTPLLYLFYLSQGLVAGGAAAWIIAEAVKEGPAVGLGAKTTAIGGALVVVALVAYAFYIASVQFTDVGNYFDPTQPTKPMTDISSYLTLLVSGSLAPQFWSAVVVGGMVPAAAGIIRWKKEGGGLAFAAVALVAALAGGLAFRFAIYVLGGSVFIFY